MEEGWFGHTCINPWFSRGSEMLSSCYCTVAMVLMSNRGWCKLMGWFVVDLAGMASNETVTCWNSIGECISVSFHFCVSCITRAEHSWESTNADELWSCLVQTVNSEACQGQLKDIQVSLLSIGNHICSMSTNLFLIAESCVCSLWRSVGILWLEIAEIYCSRATSCMLCTEIHEAYL